MKTPNFLRKLMTSPAYMDKNSAEYAAAEQYLKILYPGNVATDASGRMVEPEYDMTLSEFYKAQEKLDAVLEEAIQEVKDEYMDETGEELSDDAIEDCIELEETIDVHVLMPAGDIEIKQLEVYTLDLPEDDDNSDIPSKNKRIWRWDSEDEDNTCDECASRDGEVYESEDDIPEIPVHPNCRCWLTEEEIDPSGRTISAKPYKPKVPEVKNEAEKDVKEMTDEQKFNQAYEKLKEPEGGYTDGKNQVKDEPTNMGIKQTTLDNYAKNHPDKDLPTDVKDLQPDQAREIYKELYWDNTEIKNIENDRVRNAIFDMNVLGGAGLVAQRALNEFSDANLAVDGHIGPKTLDAINSISGNKIPEFMNVLKEKRIEYLQRTDNWPTAKGGWTRRTNAY